MTCSNGTTPLINSFSLSSVSSGHQHIHQCPARWQRLRLDGWHLQPVVICGWHRRGAKKCLREKHVCVLSSWKSKRIMVTAGLPSDLCYEASMFYSTKKYYSHPQCQTGYSQYAKIRTSQFKIKWCLISNLTYAQTNSKAGKAVLITTDPKYQTNWTDQREIPGSWYRIYHRWTMENNNNSLVMHLHLFVKIRLIDMMMLVLPHLILDNPSFSVICNFTSCIPSQFQPHSSSWLLSLKSV